MAVIDVAGDARRAFDVLKAGGIAIMPMDVGYTCAGGSAAALQKIFDTKRRTSAKRNAMIGDLAIHEDVHLVDARGQDIVRAICIDNGIPFGPIAPARMDHPLIRALEPAAREGSLKDDTVCMLVNAGAFHAEISKLSLAETHPLFGSSANMSLSGTKFRVEDIEPEITQIADIVIDHGLRKYHMYGQSSTLLDLRTLEVVRVGSGYEIIRDILARWFRIELPPPPEGFLGGLLPGRD